MVLSNWVNVRLERLRRAAGDPFGDYPGYRSVVACFVLGNCSPDDALVFGKGSCLMCLIQVLLANSRLSKCESIAQRHDLLLTLPAVQAPAPARSSQEDRTLPAVGSCHR